MKTKTFFIIFSVFIIFLSGCIEKEDFEQTLPFTQIEDEKQTLPYSQLEKSHFFAVGDVEKANWIRFWILWEDVEKEKGKYDFSFVDAVVKNFQRDNRILLLTILPFAKWDQDSCHGKEYISTIPLPNKEAKVKVGKPCNMSAYASFLSKLVERYDGDGIDDMPGLRYPVKYWEIMNEPGMQMENKFDLKFFYGPPEEYLEILKVSYETIKQTDPEAKVLMAGMAGMQPEFVQFWDKIMSEAKNYFDIANIHSISTTEEREDLFLFEFKEFLKKHGAEDKEIWITEAQYGELFSPPEDLQSVEKLLVRSTVFALANGASKIFHVGNWHEFWKSTTTQKVYETLVNKIDYFDRVEILKQEYEQTFEGVKTKVGQYKFTIGNKTVFVLWGSANLPEEIKGKVKVTDIYGNEKIMDASEISLTDSPIYVEFLQQTSQQIKENNSAELPVIRQQITIEAPLFVELDASRPLKKDYFYSHFGAGSISSKEFLQDMQELGARWVRMGFDIGIEEPPLEELEMEKDIEKPEISKETEMEIMKKIGSGEVQVYGIINLVKKLPIEEFEKEVEKIVKENPKIKVWEMFNEVATNAPRAGISKEDYFEYLKSARKVIKSICKDCLIASGSAVDDVDPYLEYVLKKNSSLVDVISFHSYHPFLNADIFSRKLRELGVNKPIYLTESQFGGMEKRVDVDEDTIARILVASYVFAFANGFEKVFPSELREMKHYPEGLRHSCLVDITGRKKPGFYAYKTLIEKVDYFDRVGEINGNYKFYIGDKIVFVIFNQKFPEEIKGRDVIVTLINGTSFVINSDNIKVSELKFDEEKWYHQS